MKKLVLIASTLTMLLAVSCNTADSKNENAATNEESGNSTETTEAAVVDNDPSQTDVIEVAVSSKDHTTLVTAVKAASLVEPLQKTGPYTVFAPTNAAFDKLPAGTVDDLLKPEKKDVLADILEYHVSVGVYTEDMLRDGQKIGQVNSQNVTITKAADGKIKVNGIANVVGSIRASNGIIYIIDEVLLPPNK